MVLKFFLYVFLFVSNLYAEESEEFYILPMGQGNAQLVIYSKGDQKIGVLYDLGSKSLQTHPKFMMRGDWKQRYVARVKQKRDVIVPSATPEKTKHAFSFTQTPLEKKIASVPMSTNAKLSVDQQKEHKENLEVFIKNLLKDLSHLFIFVSHSDADHINYLNNDTIPPEVPITLLLCGDWFGDVGCGKNETNLTTAVKDVLKFLNLRLRNHKVSTEFKFTYYKDFQLNQRIKLNDFIRERLLDSEDIEPFVQELKELCSRNNLDLPDPVVPTFYSGTFSRLYSELFSDPATERTTADARPSFIDEVKEKIYIWSMNHVTDDINGQSMILSCTLPNLDMSVILTGDAQHSTFQRIFSEYKERGNFRSVLRGLAANHIVLFVLPHHGALKNSSAAGLKFFQPDIFGIAAGDGAQHGHPSYDLIEYLKAYYFLFKRPNNFTENYEQSVEGLDFIAIQKNFLKSGKKRVEKKEVTMLSDEDEVPFLCPNLYGCIKWDKEGISTNFENKLIYGKQKYKVLYFSHIGEYPLNQLQDNNEIFANIMIDEKWHSLDISLKSLPSEQTNGYFIFKHGRNKFFAGLEVGDKIYFYQMIKMP